MEIDIYEGARGTGKSTLAFKMRQKISPTPTLINFTGFHDDGQEGLAKVSKYYEAWMQFLFKLHKHESQYVFDRFYFSEAVYSELYKDYDFKDMNKALDNCLIELSELGVKINVFFLTINDEEELKQRLIRDKVPFGKAEESVEQTLKQQDMYHEVFNKLRASYMNSNLKIHTIDTSGKTNEDVYDEIMKSKTT